MIIKNRKCLIDYYLISILNFIEEILNISFDAGFSDMLILFPENLYDVT